MSDDTTTTNDDDRDPYFDARSPWQNEFNNVQYFKPRDELNARVIHAEETGDEFLAIPMVLARGILNLKQCTAKNIVNGNREKKIMIEVQCERICDPQTGTHLGMHKNGRINW